MNACERAQKPVQEYTTKVITSKSAKERFESGNRDQATLDDIYTSLINGTIEDIPGNPAEQKYFADRLYNDGYMVVNSNGTPTVLRDDIAGHGKALKGNTKDEIAIRTEDGEYIPDNAEVYTPSSESTPRAGAAPAKESPAGETFRESVLDTAPETKSEPPTYEPKEDLGK